MPKAHRLKLNTYTSPTFVATNGNKMAKEQAVVAEKEYCIAGNKTADTNNSNTKTKPENE